MKIYQTHIFIAILTIICFNNCVSKDKNNENSEFVSEELVFVLNEFIKETEERHQKYIGNYNESFYLVRFFEIDGLEYLNLECTVVFPFMFFPYQNDGGQSNYVYDRSKMYFYRIYNRNVIIMDEENFNRSSLFEKYKNNIEIIAKVEAYFKFRISPLMSKVSFVNIKTFQILYENEKINIIPTKKVLFSPPYDSEKELEIEIIE